MDIDVLGVLSQQSLVKLRTNWQAIIEKVMFKLLYLPGSLHTIHNRLLVSASLSINLCYTL